MTSFKAFIFFRIASSSSNIIKESNINCSPYIITETRVSNSLFKLYKVVIIKISLLIIALDLYNIIIILLTLLKYLIIL